MFCFSPIISETISIPDVDLSVHYWTAQSQQLGCKQIAWMNVNFKITKVSFMAYSHHLLLIPAYTKLICSLSGIDFSMTHVQQIRLYITLPFLKAWDVQFISIMCNFSRGWLPQLLYPWSFSGLHTAVSYEVPMDCIAQQIATECHAFWDSLISPMNSATIAHNSLMLTRASN